MKKEFIRIFEKAGDVPLCAAPGGIQFAIIGMPFSVDLVASDPDGMITGLTADLPAWATLSIATELPSPDVIACISGTPGPADKGLHVVSITATDKDGNQTSSPLKVKVDNHGFLDGQPGVF